MLPTYHYMTRDIVSPYLGQRTTFDFDVANPAPRVFRERTRIRVQREGVSNDQLKGLDRTDVLQETYGAAVEPVWGVRGLRHVK